jgi:hypothetical protein
VRRIEGGWKRGVIEERGSKDCQTVEVDEREYHHNQYSSQAGQISEVWVRQTAPDQTVWLGAPIASKNSSILHVLSSLFFVADEGRARTKL